MAGPLLLFLTGTALGLYHLAARSRPPGRRIVLAVHGPAAARFAFDIAAGLLVLLLLAGKAFIPRRKPPRRRRR